MHALFQFAGKYMCEYKRHGGNIDIHCKDVLYDVVPFLEYKLSCDGHHPS